MRHIIQTLLQAGVTDLNHIRDIADLIASARDKTYLQQSAEQILDLDDQKLNHAVQQIIGGR
jgi:hypothetical protein